MRVLYYTPSCFLDQALSFAPALARKVRLHLVVEIAPESWHANLLGSSPGPMSDGLHSAEDVLAEALPAGVLGSLSGLERVSVVVYNETRALDPRTAATTVRAARALVRRGVPQVLHLNDMPFRMLAGLPLLRGAARVVGIHDPVPHSGEGSIKVRLAHGSAMRLAHSVIVHNRVQMEAVRTRARAGAERVHYIPLGAYDVYRRWPAVAGNGHRRPTVILFGRLGRYKGLDDFVAAARVAARRLHGVDFVAAGPASGGPMSGSRESLENDCRLVIDVRHLTTTELVGLVSGSALVVLPYKDATQSGALLTAYSLGRPVVVTDVGGLPEYVADGRTGLVVPVGDRQALSDAVVRVLSDSRLLGDLTAGVSDPTPPLKRWDEIADMTAAVYEQALSDRARGGRRC